MFGPYRKDLARTPNERRATRSGNLPLFRFCLAFFGPSLNDGTRTKFGVAAKTRKTFGSTILKHYSYHTCVEKRFADIQNAPGVEQARLRRQPRRATV